MTSTYKTWTIFALSIITFALAVATTAQCRFALIVFNGLDYGDYPGYGLFKYQAYVGQNTCESYPSGFVDSFGASEKTARAFGVLSCLLTGGIMVIMVLLQLFLDFGKVNKVTWWIVRVFLGLAVFTQIGTLVLLSSERFCTESQLRDSEKRCVPGPAGIVAILNALILFTASVIACLSPPPTAVIPFFKKSEAAAATKKEAGEEDSIGDASSVSMYMEEAAPSHGDFHVSPRAQEPEERVNTIVTEIDPDGSKKTTKTVFNPDGSTTITIMVEPSEIYM